jgi:hypothetical protein
MRNDSNNPRSEQPSSEAFSIQVAKRVTSWVLEELNPTHVSAEEGVGPFGRF